MNFKSVIVSIFVFILTSGLGYGQENPRKLVEKSLEAIGGETNVRALKIVSIEASAYQNHLQDSEHPDGPWVPDFSEVTELRDVENKRLRRTTATRFAGGSTSINNSIIVDGINALEVSFNGQKPQVRLQPSNEEWYIQSPERILIAALEAKNLYREPDVITQSVNHHVLSFTYKTFPVRVFINAYNYYPTAVETVSDYPFDIATGVWGDVTTRVTYSQWDLLPGGVHYPLQWNTDFNGMSSKLLFIRKVNTNPSRDENSFLIPEEARKKFVPRKIDDIPLGRPDRPAQEIVPDVIQIPGSWYTTLVRQSDGIVIIEAPISNGYSAKVIAEAEKRFPGVPIKAVITTSSYWWHFGGIREYAALNIPIYALDLNKQIIEKVLTSPRRNNPDLLARNKREAKLNIVSEKIVIGKGANRLELYPVRAATAQMMMVFLPEHKILYTSELAQPLGPNESFLYPHDLSTLITAVNQEKLNVNSIIGMHMSVTPWTKLTETVEKIVSGQQK